METKKININIDTAYRNNYENTESTDFTYILPQPIHNVTSMKLVSNEIPHMWYVFNDKIKLTLFVLKFLIMFMPMILLFLKMLTKIFIVVYLEILHLMLLFLKVIIYLVILLMLLTIFF